jgi:hypothetical protein
LFDNSGDSSGEDEASSDEGEEEETTEDGSSTACSSTSSATTSRTATSSGNKKSGGRVPLSRQGMERAAALAEKGGQRQKSSGDGESTKRHKARKSAKTRNDAAVVNKPPSYPKRLIQTDHQEAPAPLRPKFRKYTVRMYTLPYIEHRYDRGRKIAF